MKVFLIKDCEHREPFVHNILFKERLPLNRFLGVKPRRASFLRYVLFCITADRTTEMLMRFDLWSVRLRERWVKGQSIKSMLRPWDSDSFCKITEDMDLESHTQRHGRYIITFLKLLKSLADSRWTHMSQYP